MHVSCASDSIYKQYSLLSMLETIPIVPKLSLVLLVVVQGTWHKSHVEHSVMAGIYAAALCVLLACCLHTAVFIVLDRELTALFLLHTAALMLATACGMHYLLQHGDTGLASVWLQTMLTHIFYCVDKTSHEHRKQHVLPNRRSVRGLLWWHATLSSPAQLALRLACRRPLCVDHGHVCRGHRAFCRHHWHDAGRVPASAV